MFSLSGVAREGYVTLSRKPVWVSFPVPVDILAWSAGEDGDESDHPAVDLPSAVAVPDTRSHAEGPINRNQLGMGDRGSGPLGTTTELESLITRLKTRVLFGGSSQCSLRQCGSQPSVAPSGVAALDFSGTLIVTRTYCRPRCQMVTVRKGSFWTHIHSNLR